MEQSLADSTPVVKKLKQACLPFKPCTTPSPVTPVGSSGGKKRRITPSSCAARVAAKNMKVELKKSTEKLSDDKVVSSSCEVDSSNASGFPATPKTVPSRCSLDNFVHTTQKLEVTTSSMDGDLVDLTVEDESASEAVVLSTASFPATAVTDAAGGKVSGPVATSVKTVTPLVQVSTRESPEVLTVNDEAERENSSNGAEVSNEHCTQQDDACSISSSSRTASDCASTESKCATLPSNLQEDESSDVISVASTPDPVDCVEQSLLDKSSGSDAADSESEMVDSPVCDNANTIDEKLNQATVVLVKLDERDGKTLVSTADKSEVSTTSVCGDVKVTPSSSQKPKKISREERDRLKAEKERLRVLAKERREKERQDAKMQKELERAEKRKEQEQRKKEKEEERLRKLEILQEDKKKKLELKAEEKKKKDEQKAEERKLKEEKKCSQETKVSVKEKELMQKFFIASKGTAAVKPQEVKTGPFMEFEVKKNMRVSHLCRVPDLDVASMSKHLDEHLALQEAGVLYIDELKCGARHSRTSAGTWPSREMFDLIMAPSGEYAGALMRAKLLQFHENYRPAYYGTWRKRSTVISGRRPWRCDAGFFAYDVDSDDEWEEEEPGESLSHSEGEEDEENDGEQDEEGDGFFVPHGYLSEGEGCDDDDDDGKVSPEKMKDQLLAKMKNWEAEMLGRKCDVLQPVVIGISWWSPGAVPDPLERKLQEFQVSLLEEAPFEVLSTTKDQPVKSKVSKETKAKNITFIPVPDSGLPDLARLVHGNSHSIQKLVREFCEFWRSKSQHETAAGDAQSDDNAPTVKVSKRKAEAKIREIAVYEFRPHSHKRKLWYVNDSVLEKLSLSLPVPTEWKWITLASAKPTNMEATGPVKQSSGGSSVPPSPVPASGTIKSFMTPNGSVHPSSTENSVGSAKVLCGADQLSSPCLQQSSLESVPKVESTVSPSTICASGVCNSTNRADNAKKSDERPADPGSTPCSTARAKKRKSESTKRYSMPSKRQSMLLLFSKKQQQPASDTNCIVVDSPTAKADSVSDTPGPNVLQSDSGGVTGGQTLSQTSDDDCMIVESNNNSESVGKQDAEKECPEENDAKLLPETDANSNVCVEMFVDDANKPVETSAEADN